MPLLPGKQIKDIPIEKILINSHLIPTIPGLNIGSETNRFSVIFVDEARLSINTLYIGDTPILGTSGDTINIKADMDQSLLLKTQGLGSLYMVSQKQIDISTNGMNADVNVRSEGQGSKVNITSVSQVNLTAPNLNMSGSTNVIGNLSADTLTVRGNVAILGDEFVVNTKTMTVEDNIVELNKGEVGFGVTAGLSGLKIDRGDAADVFVVYSEASSKFEVGQAGSLKPIATEEYVNSAKNNLAFKRVGW